MVAMNLIKTVVLGFVLGMAVLTVTPVEAAGLIPCGGPGEPSCQFCDVTKLINNVVAWLFVVLSMVAAIMIMKAGFDLVIAQGAGDLTAAKSTITNILIGYAILLGGWLVIDLFMKGVVSGEVYKVWDAIQCVNQPGVMNAPAGAGIPAGSPYYRGVVGGGRQCAPENQSCSVEALQQAGFSAQQASVLSCIAMSESSGNPNARNRTPGSTACGTFQVTQQTWQSVRRSAGCQDFSMCTSYSCNIEVAQGLVAQRGYGPWTCPGCNHRAQGCIDQFGR